MIKDLFSLMYPRTCELCNEGLARGESQICTRCDFRLPRFRNRDESNSFLPLLAGAHLYSSVYSYIKYYKKGIGQKLLQKIKYGNKPELAYIIGYRLGSELIPPQAGFDLILPVPLHMKKLRKRGYNQSDYFAKGISDSTGITWTPDIIIRTRNNPSQTNKSRIERILNAEGIFHIKETNTILSKNILVVDDVITTGATLLACSEILYNAGAQVIGVASIAMAKG
jgi:ComF family protein